jgi:NADH-quinone oxidoreductase subunit L
MHFLEFDPHRDFALLLAALLIPLAGYVVNLFAGRRLPRGGDWLLTGGMFVSMCITVLMFAKSLFAAHHGLEFRHDSADHGYAFHWFFSSDAAAGATRNVVASIYYDPLGAAMLMVVGVVSFLVHLFSIGYMHGDRRYSIFFANISLFTFAMLGLVLSDNILFLFIFWELMGLMSYLLIGHFAHDPSQPFFHRWATWASKKAFMTTRVGDTCLLVGMLIFYSKFHTFEFTELWRLAQEEVARHAGEWPAWMTIGGLFIFGGTIGKSAQFPLHIWLPDAMAGPTPVSAMIHAATMVAAGVFLLGRTYPLMSPDALGVIAAVGTFTALLAATIGTTQYDLKAVLAYSTISQLGFMVAAVGLGGVVAGMFHMVTHAFFKACLFLTAGSVIHGCHHEQDMRNMGGIKKHMPVTYACMLISTLAIAGIPFFAGFYSKDAIILKAWESVLGGRFQGAHFFAAIALPLAALCTAFYMFRMIYMTFFGEYRPNTVPSQFAHHAGRDEHGHGEHGAHGHAQAHHGAHDEHAHVPHESPKTILIAIGTLAALGVLGGHFWLADPLHALQFWRHQHTWFESSVSLSSLYGASAPAAAEIDAHAAHLAHVVALSVSLFVALAGIAIAHAIYGRGWERSQRIASRITAALGGVYHAVANKYYVDEVVDATFIRGSFALARGLSAVDKYVVDGLVNLIGRTGRALGFGSAWVDRTFVDGAVNGVALSAQTFGSVARLLQTGRIQQYAAFAVAGGVLLAAWFIVL